MNEYILMLCGNVLSGARKLCVDITETVLCT